MTPLRKKIAIVTAAVFLPFFAPRMAFFELHLHFTTQIPVLLTAPVADFGGEWREERGLISAAPPLHHSDPRPAQGACGRLWGKGEGGERPRWLLPSTSPQRSPNRLRRLWPTKGKGEGGGRPCWCRASSA